MTWSISSTNISETFTKFNYLVANMLNGRTRLNMLNGRTRLVYCGKTGNG